MYHVTKTIFIHVHKPFRTMKIHICTITFLYYITTVLHHIYENLRPNQIFESRISLPTFVSYRHVCIYLYKGSDFPPPESSLKSHNSRYRGTVDINTVEPVYSEGSGKCVGLYRMSEYSDFIVVNRNTLVP